MKPKKEKINLIIFISLCVIVAGAAIGFSFMSPAAKTAQTTAVVHTKPNKENESTSATDVSKAQISQGNTSTSSTTKNTSTSSTDVSNGQNGKEKIAYLTFDDGPSKYTPELLKTLDKCGVHATFFVVGTCAQKYPDALKEIAGSGNVIGIHSWTHQYSYIYKNMDNFITDFNQLKDFIQKTTGVTPNICRFPGGTNNHANFKYNSGHIMQQVAKYATDNGFQYFDWNVSTGEAADVPPSKDTIVNTVVSQCKNKNTVVILCHDSNKTNFNDTVPLMVSNLKEMGFKFETLSPNTTPAIHFKPS